MHLSDLAWPLAALLLAGTGVALTWKLLQPRVAARLLLCVMMAAGLAAVWSIGGIAVGWLSQLAHGNGLLGLCGHLYAPHDRISPWLGAGCLVLVVLGTVRAIGVLRWRHALRGPRTAEVVPSLEVLDDREPRGFALPGRPGRIMVTTGLLDALHGRERDALVAHETAHLQHGHYRYLVASDLAVAVAPFLAPLRSRLRFTLERWADEAASVGVGDRQIVAKAIARAALASADQAPEHALTISSHGVPARVEALLVPVKRVPRRTTSAACTVAVVSVSAAVLQLHHIAAFVQHVC